jgi:hypothetical protein
MSEFIGAAIILIVGVNALYSRFCESTSRHGFRAAKSKR